MTDSEARRMIESVKSSQLLRGYRGSPPGDIDALTEVLLRVSQLAVDFPVIETLEMNPVLVRPAGEGVSVLDVRAKLSAER